jgi:hypothetical protein
VTRGAPSPTALALARMRVLGSTAVYDRQTLATLETAATQAGRQLIEVTTEDSIATEVTLAWVDGSEPVAGGDSGVVRSDPTAETALTFAAALRACWLDPSENPFPGVARPVESVLEARAILGTLSGSDGNDGRAAEFHRKGALRRLREAGYLAGTDTAIRLGPRVAAWSEGQVNVLRTIYQQLPVARDACVPRNSIAESLANSGDVERGIDFADQEDACERGPR